MSSAPEIGELWTGRAAEVVELGAGLDVWDFHAKGYFVVITTNRRLRSDGTAVMGAGLAKQAAERYPDLPRRYGCCLAEGRDRMSFPAYRLLLAPTKDDWRLPAVPSLVSELFTAVAQWCLAHPDGAAVLAAPGCGQGGLEWAEVRDEARRGLRGCRAVLLPPR